MTITEAFTRYDIDCLLCEGKVEKTRTNYRTALSSFLKTNGDLPVQFITDEHITLWKRRMALEGNAPSYMACNIGRFRNVIKYLKKRRYAVMDSADIENVKVKRKKISFLYPDEVQAMLHATESLRDKALIALLFASGARISEILSLDRNSIVDGEAIIIGKGDKQGTISFDPVSLRYLDEYLVTRTDRLKSLFISSQRRRLGYKRASQIMHEVSDAAGIDKNVTCHILRHSFATDMLLNGADIMAIKEQLRHEDVSTTMRYTHVTNKYRQEGYKRYHTVLE